MVGRRADSVVHCFNSVQFLCLQLGSCFFCASADSSKTTAVSRLSLPTFERHWAVAECYLALEKSWHWEAGQVHVGEGTLSAHWGKQEEKQEEEQLAEGQRPWRVAVWVAPYSPPS